MAAKKGPKPSKLTELTIEYQRLAKETVEEAEALEAKRARLLEVIVAMNAERMAQGNSWILLG